MKKPTAPTTTHARPARLHWRTQAAEARTGNAPHTADAEHCYGFFEAQRIGRFVRRAAGDIATCIEKSLQDLGGLLLAVDGEDQAGLHDLRKAIVTLGGSVNELQATIANTKCRGEAGHSDK